MLNYLKGNDMSDEKKIPDNEDLILAELEACRRGEEHDASKINPETSQAIEDLNRISNLFSETKPDASEIPESVDNLVLGHIKQKSRDIRREQKVIRIFPRYKWAAAAVMGVLVCMISYKQINKIDNPENISINDDIKPVMEFSNKADRSDIKEALDSNLKELQLADDASGILKSDRNKDDYSYDILERPSFDFYQYTAETDLDKTQYKLGDFQFGEQKNTLDQPGEIFKYSDKTTRIKSLDNNLENTHFALQWNQTLPLSENSEYSIETSRDNFFYTNNTQLVRKVNSVSQSDDVPQYFETNMYNSLYTNNIKQFAMPESELFQSWDTGNIDEKAGHTFVLSSDSGKLKMVKLKKNNLIQNEKSPDDIDGNGRVNIIDAYLMDRKLISGVSMPEKMDLNGDGNVDHEDVNTIVKTAVSLGKGEA